MLQSLDSLRGTGKRASASSNDVHLSSLSVYFTQRRGATPWTKMRELKRQRMTWALIDNNLNNLGNNVARTLDNDSIANPDILTCDLVFIMKRGI